MLLNVAAPIDRDGNGFPDTVRVVVYLFGDQHTYQPPIEVPGEFAFRLTTRDGRRLGQWVFDLAQTEAALQQLPPGPGYGFGLQLREDIDKMQRTEVLVQGRFRRPDGEGEIASSGAAEVLLGAGN